MSSTASIPSHGRVTKAVVDERLTMAQAAAVMGVGPRTVSQMCADRTLDHIAYKTPAGRVYRYRVYRSVAERWVAARTFSARTS